MGERDEGFTLEVMVKGLGASRDRYNAAIRSRHGVEEAYCALFEALNWTAAVAERLKRERGRAWPEALGKARGRPTYLPG